MIARFHNPVDTRLGYNSLVELASITENQKVALVIFPEARGLGLVDRIQDLLGERLKYIVEDVQPNPDVAQLRGTYERFWQEAGDCQTVIAVGGGSAIDTAKALIVGTQSGRFDELVALLATGKPFVPAHSKALIAVPTTAGTGSEVTPWATIWDTEGQKKYSVAQRSGTRRPG